MPGADAWSRWFQQGEAATKKKRKRKAKGQASSDEESGSSSSSSSAKAPPVTATVAKASGAEKPARERSAIELFDKPAKGVGRRQAAKNAMEKIIKDFNLGPHLSWQLRALTPDKQRMFFMMESDLKKETDPAAYILLHLQGDIEPPSGLLTES